MPMNEENKRKAKERLDAYWAKKKKLKKDNNIEEEVIENDTEISEDAEEERDEQIHYSDEGFDMKPEKPEVVKVFGMGKKETKKEENNEVDVLKSELKKQIEIAMLSLNSSNNMVSLSGDYVLALERSIKLYRRLYDVLVDVLEVKEHEHAVYSGNIEDLKDSIKGF